jgi:hypothetical protein
MPWSDAPLRSISIPQDHGPVDPYVYVGPDDPLAAKVNQDASIVFHYGNHNSGFVMGVNDGGTPAQDRGTFGLFVTSDQNGGASFAVLTSDYNTGNGALNTSLGAQTPGSNTTVKGDGVLIEATDGILLDAGNTLPIIVSHDLIEDSRSHQYKRGENGSASVSFTAVTSSTVAVPFAHTFALPPKMTTNINNGAGATAQWHSRAINVTTTGFTLLVFAATAGTWSNVDVQWTAEEPT